MLSLFHLIILILCSIDKFSHGAKDVGTVTGLDIQHTVFGHNRSYAFDYVSNNIRMVDGRKQVTT